MLLRILHTADLHLGMRFTRGYTDEVQQSLIDARFECLERLVALSNENKCDLFVVAGDMFDRAKTAQANILRALKALAELDSTLAVVLPGNHDYFQDEAGSLWDVFKQGMPEGVVVPTQQSPMDLRRYDIEAVLYPGPCISKHSSENAIDWVAGIEKDPEIPFHIGIAHGSVEGLSLDAGQAYYPMTRSELSSAGVDLWLLGHTHVPLRPEDGATSGMAMAGTPEPDGFSCQHSGQAQLITIDGDKHVSSEILNTGKYRFRTIEFTVKHEGDLTKLRSAFDSLSEHEDLVRLRLQGTVDEELLDESRMVLNELEERVFYLERDVRGLGRRITRKDIDREFTEGSFPHRLLTHLVEDSTNSKTLQMAYDLIQEVRK